MAEWANSEAILAVYFSMLVFRDQEPPASTPDGKHSIGEWIVKEAFEQATTFNQKRVTFLRAIELRFGAKTADKLRPLMKALQDAGAVRNEIAHGRYSIDDNLPNDLIWNKSIVDEKPYIYTPDNFREILNEIANASLAFTSAFLSEVSPYVKAMVDYVLTYNPTAAQQPPQVP